MKPSDTAVVTCFSRETERLVAEYPLKFSTATLSRMFGIAASEFMGAVHLIGEQQRPIIEAALGQTLDLERNEYYIEVRST